MATNGRRWHPAFDALRYLIGLGLVVFVFVTDAPISWERVLILLAMIGVVDVIPAGVVGRIAEAVSGHKRNGNGAST